MFSANLHVLTTLPFADLEVGDVERMKSRKEELEGNISQMDAILKSLQLEQRQLEDEAAKLQKKRVCELNIGSISTDIIIMGHGSILFLARRKSLISVRMKRENAVKWKTVLVCLSK